jgi:fatty acid desaturase
MAKVSVLRPEVLRELYVRPSWVPVVQSALSLALFAGLGLAALIAPWKALTCAAWPVMGLVMAGWLNAAHDCAHGTFVRSPSGNSTAGQFWSVLLLSNFTLFKHAHLEHHRFTRVYGDTESLDTLTSAADYARAMLLHNPLRPVVLALRAAAGNLPASIDTPAKRREVCRDTGAVLAWLLVAGTLTALSPATMLTLYWGPLLFMGPLVSFAALPEHHGLDASPDVFESTRSVTSNAFTRAVLWNGGFHAEHHLYPGVPSCNLSKLRQALGGGGPREIHSYLGFHARLVMQLSRGREIRLRHTP